jgi:asparagine synthase (glutamine-hydrolysing)
MSGIAGVVRFDGAPIDRGTIESMTSAMSHRGPDGIGHWSSDGVALGHCMLHSTRESLEERQPLEHGEAPLVIVMDGRVDNAEELRRALIDRGVRLVGRTDVELVLEAYAAWGERCVDRIDGDFAFAVWDRASRRLFCARDRMGMRPFHYRREGALFIFASDLHAILGLPGVDALPDESMLAQYLACDFRPGDRTLWTGIRRLEPAHSLAVSSEAADPVRYWQPGLDSSLRYRTDDEYVEHYRELLFEAVRRTARSHRPVAYEVSGGLDSTALFAVASRQQDERRLPAPGIHALTLSFPGDAAADELRFARAVAEYLGRPVQEIAPSSPPPACYWDWTRRYRDFPGYANTSMSIGLDEAAVQHGCRVLVTGNGGDEWLCSRRTGYFEEFAAGRWSNAARDWGVDARSRGTRAATAELARGTLGPLLPESIRARLRPLIHRPQGEPERSIGWLSPKLQQGLSTSSLPAISKQARGQGSERHRRQLETLRDAYSTLAFDSHERQTASLGLERRFPFLNTALVEFAFACPDRMRLRAGADKFLHREAMRGLLPERVRTRADKAEFSVVLFEALEANESEVRESIAARSPDWMDADAAGEGLRVALARTPASGWPKWQLWAVLLCDRIYSGGPLP